MNDLQKDMMRIQELVGRSFTETGSLVALGDGGFMNDAKLQRVLENTMVQFEEAVLEMRVLCEKHTPGVGNFGKKPTLAPYSISGRVEVLGDDWIHVTLNTLLPNCRFQSPIWLSDTIRRLLDAYEANGKRLPYFQEQALMVIQECCDVEGRKIYDQDNKGWKAVSNAIKGRLVEDDDQFALNIALLSARSSVNCCNIYFLRAADSSDFFSFLAGDFSAESLEKSTSRYGRQ